MATVAQKAHLPVRARLDRLGELDLVSQDVLTEAVRELEKQPWMLRVSRQAGGA